MRGGHGSGSHKQAQGDLTWEVPPELDPDFGLSLKDRDRRYMAQQEHAGTMQHADPAASSTGGAAGASAAIDQDPSGLATAHSAKPGEESQEGTAGNPDGSHAVDSQGSLTAPTVGQSSSMPLPAANLPHSLLDLHRMLLSAAASAHLLKLVRQLLESEHAGQVDVWAPIVTRLAEAAAQAVSPTAMMTHGQMDARHYIKVKRLPLVGTPEESCMLPAVVCKKNVVHKRMRTHLQWPKVRPVVD